MEGVTIPQKQDNSDATRVENGPATPPMTPASVNSGGVSTQRSTGKSKYSRKFNSSWLATPSPKSPRFMESQIPSPLSQSKPKQFTAAASSSSIQPPPSPISQYSTFPHGNPLPSLPAAPVMQYVDLNDKNLASTYPAMTPICGTSPACPPAPTKPTDYERGPVNGPRRRLYQQTSPCTGGEARHRVPMGIIPSPQGIALLRSSASAVPAVPAIPPTRVIVESAQHTMALSSDSDLDSSDAEVPPAPTKRRKLVKWWKR